MTTVPKGVEWYLNPTHSGTILGTWTCWGTGKWNCQQARKGRFCSEICQTWATLVGGGPYAEHKEDKRWLNNRHLAMWCGPSITQRQAQKLISCPSPTTKTRLLYFNRTQLAVLPDIIAWEDIFIYWGWLITPFAGVVYRTKPQCTFCVSVMRIWLHSDVHIWVPSPWTRRIWRV
jgi:hypothetical protein